MSDVPKRPTLATAAVHVGLVLFSVALVGVTLRIKKA